jgi:hypothetical protein
MLMAGLQTSSSEMILGDATILGDAGAVSLSD